MECRLRYSKVKSRKIPKKRRNRIVLNKIIGGYVLRKPDIRQKMLILNSLIVPQNVKVTDFLTSILLRNI